MKILADESVDAPVVEALRDAGHDVEFVLEISPGIPDTDVLQLAIQKKRSKKLSALNWEYQKRNLRGGAVAFPKSSI